ncbi:hypothetical protein Chor_009522 [Crotalus horridus]
MLARLPSRRPNLRLRSQRNSTKYLDVHSMDLINNAGTTDELKRLLSDLFDLKDFESNPRSAILLDLYFYTIQFSREQGFNREQTAAFFSIVKDVHEACVGWLWYRQSHVLFLPLMLCGQNHEKMSLPPFSIDLFNQDQLVLLTDYMINTYFRHYKLYKYAFTPQGCQKIWHISLFCIGATAESAEMGLSPLQEELEDTGAPAESATAALRDFIVSQLNQELTQLRLSVDQRLKATEDQFNAKLNQLEKGSAASKGAAKGKKK